MARRKGKVGSILRLGLNRYGVASAIIWNFASPLPPPWPGCLKAVRNGTSGRVGVGKKQFCQVVLENTGLSCVAEKEGEEKTMIHPNLRSVDLNTDSLYFFFILSKNQNYQHLWALAVKILRVNLMEV